MGLHLAAYDLFSLLASPLRICIHACRTTLPKRNHSKVRIMGPIEQLEDRTCFSITPLQGYTFMAPDTSPGAAPGDILGGYFIIDPNVLPHTVAPPFPGETVYQWPLPEAPAAIGLLQNFGPRTSTYITPDLSAYMQSESSDTQSNGYIEIFFNGGENALLIYLGRESFGPPVSPTESAGQFLASRPDIDIAPDVAGFTRHGDIHGPAPRPFTFQDVVQNKESFKPPTVNGPDISFDFTPTIDIAGYHVPMALGDAAHLLGVTGFNWKQTVIAPAGVTVQIDADGMLQTIDDRRTVTGSYIDPIAERPDLLSKYLYTNTDPAIDPQLAQVIITYRDSALPNSTTGYWPDYAPGYWEEYEGGADPSNPYSLYNETNTNFFRLHFEDSPRLPVTFDSPALLFGPSNISPVSVPLFRTFRTELMGEGNAMDVTANDPPILPGLGVSWRSNARFLGDPNVVIAGLAAC